jgi:hypothetical protein
VDKIDSEVITADKVFGFIFFQAYRQKKIGKGVKGFFDRGQYDKVMERGNNLEQDADTPLGNVCGSENINQYLCTVRNLLDAQRRQGLTRVTREDLMSDSMKGLIEIVTCGGERVLKENFKERCDGEFAPFRIIEHLPDLEEEFWNHKKMTNVYGCCALRDRFQFLHTLGAVMRSDSVYKADLADMCNFKFKQPREPDPYHIVVMRDGEGKQ